ncbi:MAG: MFS transporter [Pirellulales bacterium]
MPEPGGDILRFACPSCHVRLRAPRGDAGSRIRCPKCQSPLVVPAPAKQGRPAQESDQYELWADYDQTRQGDRAGYPTYIPVICRVCDTLMHATDDQIGQTLTCPDCGTKNQVKPPPEEPVRRRLVEQGERLELADAGGAAGSMPYIPVVCRLCDTRMYGRDEEVGTQIACPDCGTLNKVPPPTPEQRKTQPPPDSGGELEVEEALARPSLEAMGLSHLFEVDDDEAKPRSPRREAHRKEEPTTRLEGPVRKERSFERAEPTLRPERKRVLSFPWQPSVWVVFLFMSSWAMFTAVLLLAAAAAGSAPRAAGLSSAPGWVMAMLLGCISVVSAIGWFIVASVQGLTVLEQTSAGSDQIDDWPEALWIDWALQSAYVLNAFAMGGAVGYGLKALLNLVQPGGEWLVPLFAGLLFPFILLSMLENGSAIAPVSTQVAKSVVRAPGQWILHYLWGGATMVLLVAVALAFWWIGYWALLLIAPVATAVWLIHFRLLGILAWHCSFAVDQDEDKEEDNPRTSAVNAGSEEGRGTALGRK